MSPPGGQSDLVTLGWAVSPTLAYAALLPGAVLVGLFALPAFGLTRQAIGAMVPEELRRPAFSLDSITVEISFMLGPLVGVLIATQLSTTVALLCVGGAQVAAGLALVVLDPPVAEESASTVRLPRQSWFSLRFVAVLMLMAASTAALAGTDVAALATLRDQGRTELVGLMFAFWALGSIAGGAVHGGLPRAPSSVALVLALGLLTMPLGLVGSWWALALLLLPAGALCAPSITSTGRGRHPAGAERGAGRGDGVALDGGAARPLARRSARRLRDRLLRAGGRVRRRRRGRGGAGPRRPHPAPRPPPSSSPPPRPPTPVG